MSEIKNRFPGGKKRSSLSFGASVDMLVENEDVENLLEVVKEAVAKQQQEAFSVDGVLDLFVRLGHIDEIEEMVRSWDLDQEMCLRLGNFYPEDRGHIAFISATARLGRPEPDMALRKIVQDSASDMVMAGYGEKVLEWLDTFFTPEEKRRLLEPEGDIYEACKEIESSGEDMGGVEEIIAEAESLWPRNDGMEHNL